MIKNNTRNWALVIGGVILLLLLYYFRTVVAYIIGAWILSLLGQPLMNVLVMKTPLGRFKGGRSIGALLVLLLFVVGIVLYAILFIPLVIHQVDILSNVDYNAFGKLLAEPLEQLKIWLESKGLLNVGDLKTQDNVQNFLLSWIDPSKITAVLGSFLFGLKDALVGLFSIFFIAFFFLREQGLFMSGLKMVVPQSYEAQVEQAVKEATRLLTRYFGGELLRMISMVSFIFLALSLAGIPNALFIAFFAGIMNIIPYVGSLLGALFGIFVTLTNSIDSASGLAILSRLGTVAIIFMLAQLLDNFVLQPVIFSSRIKAHPLEIFLVFLVGAQIGGLFGMLLAIPTYTVIRVVAKVFFSHFKLVRKLTQNM